MSAPFAARDLPDSELVKLGPAIIDQDRLQISVHNGSTWDLEKLVALTILRPRDLTADAVRQAGSGCGKVL